jgi:hypothetical protein
VIAVLVVMVDMNMLAAVHYFDNNMAPFSFAAVVSLSDGGGTVCVEGGALCYHITAQHVGRRSALSPPSPHPLPACLPACNAMWRRRRLAASHITVGGRAPG